MVEIHRDGGHGNDVNMAQSHQHRIIKSFTVHSLYDRSLGVVHYRSRSLGSRLWGFVRTMCYRFRQSRLLRGNGMYVVHHNLP